MNSTQSFVVEPDVLHGSGMEVTEPSALPHRKSEYVEFIVWGLAFLVFRLAVQMLGNTQHFYRDENAFIEGALRMPASGLSSGDYIHGPIIHYLLLFAYLVVAAFKLLFRQIGGSDDFVRWYIEHPESLGAIGRLVMSVGGAALIVVTMALAKSISDSRDQARLAALMLMSMPLFHHASWYIKEDLWAALFGAGAAVVAYRRRSAGWTGMLWGAAIAAKYTAVAVGPALLLILMAQEENKQFSWKTISKNGARLGLTGIVTFLALNPYTLINLSSFLNQIAIINRQYLRADLVGGPASPPFLAGRLVTEFLPFDIGLLAVVSICGGLALSRFRHDRSYLPAILACGAVMAMIAVSRAGFPRTMAIAIPWLAVVAAGPFKSVLRLHFSRIAVATAVGLIAMLQTAGYYRYVTAAHTGELARLYVEQSVAQDAVILMEDVHEYSGDAAPYLRSNVRGLKAEFDDLVSRDATGRLNQMRQAVASASPIGRFEILGVKDFSVEGSRYLDRADVVISCKWPSIFPENRAYNLPEDLGIPSIASYQERRQMFLNRLSERGFRLLVRFDPSVAAKWSFIDRPDPNILSPAAWFNLRGLITGPEIAIYSRSTGIDRVAATAELNPATSQVLR